MRPFKRLFNFVTGNSFWNRDFRIPLIGKLDNEILLYVLFFLGAILVIASSTEAKLRNVGLLLIGAPILIIAMDDEILLVLVLVVGGLIAMNVMGITLKIEKKDDAAAAGGGDAAKPEGADDKKKDEKEGDKPAEGQTDTSAASPDAQKDDQPAQPEPAKA